MTFTDFLILLFCCMLLVGGCRGLDAIRNKTTAQLSAQYVEPYQGSHYARM